MESPRQYDTDGIYFPVPVLSDAEVSRYRSAIDELAGFEGGSRDDVGWTHLYFGWAHELATHPAVLDAVETILGPEILIYGSLILCKYPYDPAYVRWHQDGTYSGLHVSPSTSAWIALAESTVENGCMRVIPGSHRSGRLPHHEIRADDSLLNHTVEIEVEVDERRATDIVLRPGEMSLHHSSIIHGSNPNRTGTTRLGYVVRYVTPKFPKPPTPMVHARGRADCSHFDLLDIPPAASVQGGFADWLQFVRAWDRRRDER